jgi:hypothetical protein
VAGKRPKDEVLSEIELKLELETVQTTLANKLRVASHRGLRLGGGSTGLWLVLWVALSGCGRGLIQRRQHSSSASPSARALVSGL